MTQKYRVRPLLLGEAEVGCALDVFWGMNKDQGRVTVPILAFLIEGGRDPILAAAAAPMGPRTLDIGSRELFYDRQDVAAMVDTLWERIELIEGDTELFPGIECILYPNSHTPGSQCVYIKTLDGVIGCVGDMVRKVDMNVRKAIPPGIYYDLEQMQRAMRDIALRGDIIYPAHDPLVLEENDERRRAALSPGKPWP